MNRIDLDGRNAVVTGGAQGIGRAIVERFLASGARVTIWDRDRALAEAAVAEIGGPVSFNQVDVTDWDAVRSAVARTAAEMGRIEIMVNNAGIAGMNATVADYPVEEWRRVIDIDLNGVFYGCKAVVPGMVTQGYGRIVNIASIAGKEGNPNASPYSAAKAGVIALTKSLGKELAGQDIAVNCVTPAAASSYLGQRRRLTPISWLARPFSRPRKPHKSTWLDGALVRFFGVNNRFWA